MNTWKTAYPADLEILFASLKEELPRLGSNCLDCLKRGYTPQQLATTLAIELRREKRTLESRLDNVRQTLSQSEELAESQAKALRASLEAQERATQEKEEKIIALNRIIARQQEQLNALLGNEK